MVGRMGRKPIEGIADHDLILSDPVDIPDGVEGIGIVVRKFLLQVLTVGHPRKKDEESETQE